MRKYLLAFLISLGGAGCANVALPGDSDPQVAADPTFNATPAPAPCTVERPDLGGACQADAWYEGGCDHPGDPCCGGCCNNGWACSLVDHSCK